MRNWRTNRRQARINASTNSKQTRKTKSLLVQTIFCDHDLKRWEVLETANEQYFLCELLCSCLSEAHWSLTHTWSKVASCATHCSIWSGHLQLLSHSACEHYACWHMLTNIPKQEVPKRFPRSTSWSAASDCGTFAQRHNRSEPGN